MARRPGPVSRAVAAQRGQTAVEYIGVVLLVIAMIAAVATSGLANAAPSEYLES